MVFVCTFQKGNRQCYGPRYPLCGCQGCTCVGMILIAGWCWAAEPDSLHVQESDFCGVVTSACTGVGAGFSPGSLPWKVEGEKEMEAGGLVPIPKAEAVVQRTSGGIATDIDPIPLFSMVVVRALDRMIGRRKGILPGRLVCKGVLDSEVAVVSSEVKVSNRLLVAMSPPADVLGTAGVLLEEEADCACVKVS